MLHSLVQKQLVFGGALANLLARRGRQFPVRIDLVRKPRAEIRDHGENLADRLRDFRRRNVQPLLPFPLLHLGSQASDLGQLRRLVQRGGLHRLPPADERRGPNRPCFCRVLVPGGESHHRVDRADRRIDMRVRRQAGPLGRLLRIRETCHERHRRDEASLADPPEQRELGEREQILRLGALARCLQVDDTAGVARIHVSPQSPRGARADAAPVRAFACRARPLPRSTKQSASDPRHAGARRGSQAPATIPGYPRGSAPRDRCTRSAVRRANLRLSVRRN